MKQLEDIKLPCDVKVGSVVVKAGCSVKTLVRRMEAMNALLDNCGETIRQLLNELGRIDPNNPYVSLADVLASKADETRDVLQEGSTRSQVKPRPTNCGKGSPPPAPRADA